MPKIPKGEWGEFTDPESDEYAPDIAEIQEERKMEGEVHEELARIESLLRYGDKDPYTGEVKEFSSISPEDLWDQLAYLHIDFVEVNWNESKGFGLTVNSDVNSSSMQDETWNTYEQVLFRIKQLLLIKGTTRKSA